MAIQMIFWAVVILIMIVVETQTIQLVCIWFAVGAIAAFVAAWVELSMTAQLLVFVISSIVLLVLTRPILKKTMVSKIAKTNADLDIGETATVIEEIDNAKGTGRASRQGVDWSAVSATGEIIPAGTLVIIQEIKSTKLIVVPQRTNVAAKI